jgi:hypothetical protein
MLGSSVKLTAAGARGRGNAGALMRAGGPPMRFKVHDGTQSNAESSMCNTCRHSTIVRGHRLDEEIVLCRGLSMRGLRITFKVHSCSSYNDMRLPTYMEMMEDAWVLQPGTRRRPPGFVRGSELREKEIFAPRERFIDVDD